MELAADVGLDLVEVSPNADPPVCKVIDWGKHQYAEAQKAKAGRRRGQHALKEMKLRPRIDEHDYQTKTGHVLRFLKSGHKVKITIMFRGREQSRPELGSRLLDRLAEDVAEVGRVETAPRQEGRNMHMTVSPMQGKEKE